MNLPPLPVPTLPMDAAHTWALAAYYKALEKDGPDIDKSKSALEMAIRTYAEQYGRICAEAERERCCRLIFGHCDSDNVAQRTVDAIRSDCA